MQYQDELEQSLQLETRKKLYEAIEENPGLHFRELQRRVNLATGSLQYHLEFLQKKHLVRIEKQGKFNRYYTVRGRQFGEDSKLMSILRQESMRKIIVFLLQKKGANNSKIAENISLSPSTTSSHLKKLIELNLIQKKKKGKEKVYYITEPDKIALMLVEYKKSFLDEMVEGFADIWQQL
ncbi:MAG: winged helix-turn-helix transcriptional regulator [Candidatus Diapherotrites archaeon]